LHYPHAEIRVSHPGLGIVLGARVRAEFGADTTLCGAHTRPTL
jgi:hypothetical protein